jgi:hypothetical protein
MYECEHWACNSQSGDDSPVCIDHAEQFADGQLDDCPSCDMLKEAEFTLCGDCDLRGSPAGLLDFDDFIKREDQEDWYYYDEWDVL